MNFGDGRKKKFAGADFLRYNPNVFPRPAEPAGADAGDEVVSKPKGEKPVSGKQAKAKRKSAAKAAKTAAPVPALASSGARLEEFIIRDVRCFAGEHRVPIRPITLLVGENSTGKTTFLGGYRVIHKLTETLFSAEASGFSWMEQSPPSFNDKPFQMGTFRDIVNRSALKSPSPSFQLGAKIPYQAFSAKQSWVDKAPTPNTRKKKSGKADLVYSFGEIGPGPAVQRADVIFSEDEEIEVTLGKHRFDGVHCLAIYDQRAGKHVNAGGFSRAIYAREIASALSRNRDGKTLKGMRNINKILDRQFYPTADKDEWRQLKFCNESVVFSFAPTRPAPERTYDPVVSEDYDPEGGHIPMLLARLSRTNQKEWAELRKRLIDFGKESEMFSDFNVKGSRLIGDPFQIRVKVAGAMSNLLDVGYGVGQIYPLLAQVMRASQQKRAATFLLQEPESHLHPQAQAALASFFARSAQKDGHSFIIETHGDNIIDRVRICVSNGLIPPEDVVILYFERQRGGNVKIHPIMLDGNANLLDVPPGYRDFFVRESDLLLGFEKMPKA